MATLSPHEATEVLILMAAMAATGFRYIARLLDLDLLATADEMMEDVVRTIRKSEDPG